MAKYNSILATLLVVTLAVSSKWQNAEGVRVKLFKNEEPDSERVYNTYRIAFADEHLYYLGSAGVLQDQDIAREILGHKVGADGEVQVQDFRYNSSEQVQAFMELRYFIPYDERAALQVYDDPRDRNLAAGPQVDQELCGLHLDYMHHLALKFRGNVANSSEYSIARILDTYDWPRFSFLRGNNYFLGDYQGCGDCKLNVMRQELSEVNKTAADKYLGGPSNAQTSDSRSISEWISDNLGPLVGFPRKTRGALEAMQKHKAQLRTVPMRYCMAAIRWPSWPKTPHKMRNIAARTGICLPESCDSNSLQLHGDKIKRLTDLQSNDFHRDYYISDLYCLPDEQSELRNPLNYTSTVLFVVFNAIWIAILLAATFGKRSNHYLDCWCISKNLHDFWAGKKGRGDVTDGEVPTRINLDPIEGLKVFAALMVICAHAFSISLTATWNNYDGHKLVGNSFVGSLLVMCPTSVDIFFVLTGVLTMYTTLSKHRKSLAHLTFWISFIVYRYIRIVPLYALVHWFLNSGFRFVGSGPLWDYGTSHSAWSKICQDESWWEILLPQANFKSPAKTCNTVGWYLANDIQFTLITPLVVLLYAYKPSLGHLLTGSTILALVASHVRFYQAFAAGAHNVFKWDLMTFTGVFHELSDGYVHPQYRVVSYLIGLVAGYLLYEYGNKTLEWSQSFMRRGKILIYVNIYLLCFLPFLSTLVPLDNKPLVQTLAPILLGTMHATASVSIAVLILFICTGNLSDRASAICSWSGFRTLANASLSIVLVQVPLIIYRTHTLSTLPELSQYHLVSTLIIWSVETIALAVAVHVLYEVPIRRFLLKFLLNSLQKKQPTQNGICKEQEDTLLANGKKAKVID